MHYPEDTDVIESKIIARSYPKARKEHRCECCGRRIFPGEKYERVAAIVDGEFWWGKYHMSYDCSI